MGRTGVIEALGSDGQCKLLRDCLISTLPETVTRQDLAQQQGIIREVTPRMAFHSSGLSAECFPAPYKRSVVKPNPSRMHGLSSASLASISILDFIAHVQVWLNVSIYASITRVD